MSQVKAVPEGYHRVTAYLVVNDAAKAIEFYGRAFGAQELFRMPGPNGSVMHAELQIGDSRVMLADEAPGMTGPSPRTLKGTAVTLFGYVPDVDAAAKKAVSAGATQRCRPPTCSGATGTARWRIRSATRGSSPRTSRTSRRTRCTGGWRRWADPPGTGT